MRSPGQALLLNGARNRPPLYMTIRPWCGIRRDGTLAGREIALVGDLCRDDLYRAVVARCIGPESGVDTGNLPRRDYACNIEALLASDAGAIAVPDRDLYAPQRNSRVIADQRDEVGAAIRIT